MIPTFNHWLSIPKDKGPLYTPDQSLVPTIAAFPNGLTHRELRARFDLDSDVFNQLLDAYISLGILTATKEGDTTRYRARTGMTL